jgi:hypothetical protein
MTRPMTRVDWAWFITCVAFGLFFATLALLSEIGDNRPYYGMRQIIAVANGQPVASKLEPVVVPSYDTRVTILTNEKVPEIIQAAQGADPNIETSVAANRPRMHLSEYFFIFFASTVGFMMFSYLFRIIEKIFIRLLHHQTHK